MVKHEFELLLKHGKIDMLFIDSFRKFCAYLYEQGYTDKVEFRPTEDSAEFVLINKMD